ncbi:MAG: 2-oxoacid:acceptor oxidoreductase subunit alpha [Elusimicrobia bacterium]|nr:2-oxoacid:acceptor oxidoreductase subunit alpha [Elusimicrobiota bacterium]MBU2614267.1 2-oxoacid:acceptor oxidoreductase subunit alpha [Elusimicrobiota bacterium]
MEISVLVGGKAGEGIDQSSLVIAKLINQLGYQIYVYRDYPSLIRGGHTFSIIRGAQRKISAHYDHVDYILAFNQDCIDLHKDRIKKDTCVIYDSDIIKPEIFPPGLKTAGIPLAKIVKEENAIAIMKNSCILGSFCKVAGIKWEILEQVFKNNIHKELEQNLKIARRGYDEAKEADNKISRASEKAPMPVVTGNDAISLGLVSAGLEAFLAYPMTPTSGVLHFLAQQAEEFSLKVVHPESEIAVMLMATGFAYAGKRAAVATSGGGFCLMTEGLSFAAMAELPVVIVLGQRPGPSTGLPTYSCQTELHFALNAGQGEFSRFIVAPGDADEAYFWSAFALDAAWKYQIPSFVLTDKTLSEGNFNLNTDSKCFISKPDLAPLLWDRKNPQAYKRYQVTETGISPLAFVPEKDVVIKVNSYEHDEAGITTEEPEITKMMQDKRLLKEKYLSQELEKIETVKIYGNKDSKTALVCWGSNKGVCIELAEKLGLKVIQPVVLSPFPENKFREALKGIEKTIYIENNSTGQLERLVRTYGFKADKMILRYDGRPFSLEGLEAELKKVI